MDAYLVRLVQNHILVMDYKVTGGDRTVYDPDSLDARFITATFEPAPIDGDIDAYLIDIN